MQIALDTTFWTVFNHITIWGSVITYFVFDFVYNYYFGGPYVGSLTQAMMGPTFWFLSMVSIVILVTPVLSYRFYNADVHPSLADKIRYKRKMMKSRSRQNNDVLRTPSAKRARRSLRSGYAFAHQVKFNRHRFDHLIKLTDFIFHWDLRKGLAA